MSSILPINSSKHEHSLDLVAEEKLKFDFTKVTFDPLICDAKFLPYLAYERRVNIDGLTETQSRTLIDNAPEIHKHKGTVFAVETALCSMFSDAEIIDGFSEPERVWEFDAKVNLPTDANATFDARTFTIARRLVNEAKNGQSRFINFDINMPDIELNLFNRAETAFALELTNELEINGDLRPIVQTAVLWDLNIGDYNE